MDNRGMMRKSTILFLTICINVAGWSQSKDSVVVIEDDPEMAFIDSMLVVRKNVYFLILKPLLLFAN